MSTATPNLSIVSADVVSTRVSPDADRWFHSTKNAVMRRVRGFVWNVLDLTTEFVCEEIMRLEAIDD